MARLIHYQNGNGFLSEKERLQPFPSPIKCLKHKTDSFYPLGFDHLARRGKLGFCERGYSQEFTENTSTKTADGRVLDCKKQLQFQVN